MSAVASGKTAPSSLPVYEGLLVWPAFILALLGSNINDFQKLTRESLLNNPNSHTGFWGFGVLGSGLAHYNL